MFGGIIIDSKDKFFVVCFFDCKVKRNDLGIGGFV